MTYQLMQSDLEFAAFLDWAGRNATRIEKRERRPRTHLERVMLRYAVTEAKKERASECRCGNNHKQGEAA